jgi:hypothetical protein
VIQEARAVLDGNSTIKCEREEDIPNIGQTVKDSIKSSVQNNDYTNCIYCLKDIERNLLKSLYSNLNATHSFWMVDVNINDDRNVTKIEKIWDYLPLPINNYFTICKISNLQFSITNLIKN